MNWGQFAEDAVTGGLQGYEAARSGGMRPGLSGFAEAVLRPEQVTQRGRVKEAVDSVQPDIAEITRLAQSGDIGGAQKKLVDMGSNLLRQGVDPQVAQYVIKTVAEPVLAVQMSARMRGQLQGVDYTTPKGANQASQAMVEQDPNQVSAAATLSQNAVRAQASADSAATADALRPLKKEDLQSRIDYRKDRMANPQKYQQPGSGNVFVPVPGGQMLVDKRDMQPGTMIPGNPSTAVTPEERKDSAAEREFRSIDDAVAKVTQGFASGNIADVSTVNQRLGALNSRIVRANQKYGRDMPTYFATPEGGVRPVSREGAGQPMSAHSGPEAGSQPQGQQQYQGAIQQLPDGKFKLPTGEIVDNRETLRNLRKQGLIPNWDIQ